MKRTTLKQEIEDPPQTLNGFQVTEKDRLKLSELRCSGFPNLQIHLMNNKQDTTETYVAVVSLDTLVSRNFKLIAPEEDGPLLSFSWQEQLPPGLATGRQAAKSLLELFNSQEECQKVYTRWKQTHKDKLGMYV